MPPFYEYLSLTLFRDLISRPWGFRIQGGVDVNFPLTVQRVFSGSPADEQLLRGDVIEVIDGYNVTKMTHKQVQDLIRVSGPKIVLGIKRPQQAAPLPYTSPPSQKRQQNYSYSSSSSLNQRDSSKHANVTSGSQFGISYGAGPPGGRRPYSSFSQPASPSINNDSDYNYYGGSLRYPTTNGYKNASDDEQDQMVFTPVSERRKFFSQPTSPELQPARNKPQQRGRTFSNTETSKLFSSSNKTPMLFGWGPSAEKMQKARLEASRSASVIGQPTTAWMASNTSIASSRETSTSPVQQHYKFNSYQQPHPPTIIPRCTSTSEIERGPTRFGYQQTNHRNPTQQSRQEIKNQGSFQQQQHSVKPAHQYQSQMNPYHYPSSQDIYQSSQSSNMLMNNSSSSEPVHLATGQKIFRTSTSIRVENRNSGYSSPKPYRQVVRRLSLSQINNGNNNSGVLSSTQKSTQQNLPSSSGFMNEAKAGHPNYRSAFPASYEFPKNTNSIKCHPAIERPANHEMNKPHVYQIVKSDSSASINKSGNYKPTIAIPLLQTDKNGNTPLQNTAQQQNLQPNYFHSGISETTGISSYSSSTPVAGANGFPRQNSTPSIQQYYFPQEKQSQPKYAHSVASEMAGVTGYSPSPSVAGSNDFHRQNSTPTTSIQQVQFPQERQLQSKYDPSVASERSNSPAVSANTTFDSYKQTKVPTPFTLSQQLHAQKLKSTASGRVKSIEAGVTEF